MRRFKEDSEVIHEIAPGPTGIVRGSLARMAFLISLGWLGTNVGLNTGEFVLTFFLKEKVNLDPLAISTFFGIGQTINYVKPLAGICTDSIPLFGTRRRHYLLLSLLGTGIFFLLLIYVPHTYSIMLGVYVLLYITVAFTSTTLGGVMVEVGMQHRAEGRLTSQRIGMFRLGSLIGQPIGGWLASFPFAFGMVFAAAWHLILVPLYYAFLPEAPTAKVNTDAWKEAKRQWNALTKSPTLMAAAGMIFLVAAAPGFQTPLLFYQANTLGFSKLFIGMLGTVSAASGIAATIFYFVACRRQTLSTLLIGSIIVHALGVLCYLRYNSPSSAIAVAAITGVTGTLATLPVYDLACRATPKGTEAIGYAIMMSVWNLTNRVSDVTGSFLYTKFHLTFMQLVWVDAGTTILVLVAVPFLPAALAARRDEVPALAAVVETPEIVE